MQDTANRGPRQSGDGNLRSGHATLRVNDFCPKYMPDFIARTIETADGCGDEAAMTCPVCGEVARQEKCKVVCRSERCTWRIIYNCSEF